MKKSILISSLLFTILCSYAQTAKKLYKNGRDKYSKDDYKGAIADFTKAIELDANYAEAYEFRGFIKNEIKDYQGANEDFSKAIEIDSNYVEAYIDRGDLKYNLKEYQSAINDYTKAIQIDSTDYIFFSKRAHAKFDLNNDKEAIGDFNKAIELNPNFKLDQGHYKKTLTENSKDIQEAINYANDYLYRGLANNKLSNYKSAIIDFTKVLEVNITQFYSRYSELDPNYLYQKTGYRISDRILEELSPKIWPNFIQAGYNRGISNLKLQYYESAADDFTNVLKLNNNYTYANYYRGIATYKFLEKQGATINMGIKEAIEDLTKFINSNPNETDAYLHRGLAISQTNVVPAEKAIDDFNMVIKLNPENADSYYYKAAELFKNNGVFLPKKYTIDDVIDNFTLAIRYNPYYPEAYFKRGLAYTDFNKKDYKSAIKDYNKAIEFKPNYTEAYYERGNAKLKLQLKGEACLDWKTAAELGSTLAEALLKAYCK